MNCPRCGTILRPEYRFCPRCNLPLQTQPALPDAQQATPYRNASPQSAPVAPSPAYQAGASGARPQPSWPGGAAPSYPPQASQPGYFSPAAGVQAGAIASPPFDPWPVEMPRQAPGGEVKVEEQKREEPEESENERLLIFSDAIVAFAITIAAVPLKVPKELDTIQANFTVELICYILGFVLVYGLWRDHHSIFHHLKRNNTWLVALNMLLLTLIVLIPVGFIVMISAGFGVQDTFTNEQLTTLAEGMAIFFGATFCGGLLLLLVWISARIRPAAFFGGRGVPEKPFLTYMTLRLILRPISFAAYTVIVFALILGYWFVALGIYVVLLAVQLLVLGLYRRRYQDILHRYLGREETMRLQLFSDAVFAVAITITVAQIDPAAKAEEIWSLVGTFIFSLLFLVVFWLLHYRIFRHVRRLNGTLIAWNFVFLLLIILDFTTARLYTSHMEKITASIPFSLFQLLIASILFFMWQYAKRHKPRQEPEPSLIKKQLTRRQRRRLNWVVGANPLIFLLLTVAAFVRPISTPVYVAAYALLFGLTWLLAVLTTLGLPKDTAPDAMIANPLG